MSTLFMLDSDTASFIIKRRHIAVQRFLMTGPQNTCISVVTEAEQRVGMHKMEAGSALHLATTRFLDAIRILPWDSDAAREFARIYSSLSRMRQQIGDLDTMIAAHAMAAGATLVTNNMRHFSRIPDALSLENWLETAEPGG
jgi:tRNA(fMet)-specific endonuclease VapC